MQFHMAERGDFATLSKKNKIYAKATVFVKTSLVKGRGTALKRGGGIQNGIFANF